MISTGDATTSPHTARLGVAGRVSAVIALDRAGLARYAVYTVTQLGRRAAAPAPRPTHAVDRARIARAVAAAVPIGLIDRPASSHQTHASVAATHPLRIPVQAAARGHAANALSTPLHVF